VSYRILIDYGSEGRKYITGAAGEIVEYDDIQEAVTAAITDYSRYQNWEIVQPVKWKVELL
jgi:hypothetical protein